MTVLRTSTLSALTAFSTAPSPTPTLTGWAVLAPLGVFTMDPLTALTVSLVIGLAALERQADGDALAHKVRRFAGLARA